MAEINIADTTREYVLKLLSGKLPDNILFHTIKHTQEVIKAAIEIAQECRFTPKQLKIVAFGFHNCDCTAAYINYKDSSKTITSDFYANMITPNMNNCKKKLSTCV